MAKTLYILFFLMIGVSSMSAQNAFTMQKPPRIFPKLFIDSSLYKTDVLISRSFYSPKFRIEKLPLFCKIEHKMEVNARFPVRIRLGSVDYVDKLEGKGH